MSSLRQLLVLLFVLGPLACAPHQEAGPITDSTKVQHRVSAPTHLAKRYQIETHLDAATSGVLGSTTGATLLALKKIKENPARTIIDLMIIHKVRGANILEWTPGLRSKIEMRANNEFERLGADGKTIVTRTSQIVESLLDLTRVVELQTELSLENNGNALRGRHSVTGLGFSVSGLSTVVPLPGRAAGMISSATPGLSVSVDSASLHITGHKFEIPIGEMALTLFVRLAGANDLTSLLESAVGCAELARNIGLSDLMPIEDACKDGIKWASRVLEYEITSARMTLLDIGEGHCKLVAGSDGVVERLVDGQFTIIVTSTGQTLTGDAPFKGHRVKEITAPDF